MSAFSKVGGSAGGIEVRAAENGALVAQDLGEVGKNLVTGDFANALSSLAKTGGDVGRVAADVAMAPLDTVANGLKSVGLNQAGDVIKGLEQKAENIVGNTVGGACNAAVGVFTGANATAKDLLRGDFGAAAGDALKTGMNALALASYTNPVGLAANVAANAIPELIKDTPLANNPAAGLVTGAVVTVVALKTGNLGLTGKQLAGAVAKDVAIDATVGGATTAVVNAAQGKRPVAVSAGVAPMLALASLSPMANLMLPEFETPGSGHRKSDNNDKDKNGDNKLIKFPVPVVAAVA